MDSHKKGLLMNMRYTVLLIVACVITPFFIDARTRAIQTEREFDQQLTKSNIFVVLFYDGVSTREGRGQQDKLKPLFRMYETTSGRRLYDDADIVFTKVNTKNQATKDIAGRYGVGMRPSFLIFLNHQPVVDKNGRIAQLVGFVSEHELQEFINSFCMPDIKRLVSSKEQSRKDRFTKSQEESDPYFYPAVYYAPEYDFSWQKPLKYDSQGNEQQ